MARSGVTAVPGATSSTVAAEKIVHLPSGCRKSVLDLTPFLEDTNGELRQPGLAPVLLERLLESSLDVVGVAVIVVVRHVLDTLGVAPLERAAVAEEGIEPVVAAEAPGCLFTLFIGAVPIAQKREA